MPIDALRAGGVNARRPRGTCGRSAAESIDGAEDSGILKRVMACAPKDMQKAAHTRHCNSTRGSPD